MSIINLNSPTDLYGFYIVYEGSTNLEKKGIYGITHLMEHLVCKALDPYEKELYGLGLDFNAYTSGNEVVFYLKGLDENLSKWRNKFVNLLTDFNVTKEEMENERNIVIQEYMDSFNSQRQNHWLNLDRKKYNVYNPIGLLEDLQSLSYLDCLNYFEKQYMNPSKIINVSKNIEFGMDIDFVSPDQTKLIKEGNYPVTLQRDNIYNGKTSLLMSSNLIKEDFAKIDFVNMLYIAGLQSPLYNIIREKNGLAYSIGISLSRYNSQGRNTFSTMTNSEGDNVERIIEMVNEIFNDSSKHLTQERFDIIRNYLKSLRTKQEINRYSNVDEFIQPDEWDVFKILDTITLEECIKISDKYFKNYTVSRDDKEFI